MGQVVKGPFDLEVGGSILAGIETLAVTYGVKETAIDSVQGNTYTFPGAHSASIEATFIENDVAALAVALPQYHINNGGTLSTGEVVSDPDGAIDVVPGGVTSSPNRDLIIVASGHPGQVARFTQTSSEISGVEVATGNIRKVKVKFIVQPTQGHALVQFFKEAAIAGIS